MKKTFTFFALCLFACIPFVSRSQQDTVSNAPGTGPEAKKDALYDRPFITIGKTSTAVGGYVEGNTNYFVEDGVTEGFSMELRRFNIFLYSRIHDKIRFISEVEFEHGTEEIALETALLDFEFHPAFNLRAGILLPQIGLVNANHDSPKWEFVERPFSSTGIIPSTLSEVGFGLHGKWFAGSSALSYDVYLVNGLQDGVTLNDEGRTSLEAGKNPEMFGEDNNGTPMVNLKLGFANSHLGEVGLSYYGGIYNRYRFDGVEVEPKRKLSIAAFDLTTRIRKLKIQGELAMVNVDVPAELTEIYGERQMGAFLELGHPVLKRKMLGFENAVLSVHIRGERVDYNQGSFEFDGSSIGDEVNALAAGISWRPAAGTVLRFNYRNHRIFDHFDNEPARLGGFQVGVASYF